MKTVNLIYFLVAIFTISLSSCKTETKKKEEVAKETKTKKRTGQAFLKSDEGNPTVLQIAIGSKDHTTLVAAVQAA